MTDIRPRRLRKQQQAEEALRLRRSGLSYRAIGNQMGMSYTHAHRLCHWAFKQITEQLVDDAAATLGGEVDRLDGLIRSASAIMLDPRQRPSDRLRAAEVVRRCADTKVHWLGLAAPEKIQIEAGMREAMVRGEVAGLSDEELDRELEALGYAVPEPAQLEAGVAA